MCISSRNSIVFQSSIRRKQDLEAYLLLLILLILNSNVSYSYFFSHRMMQFIFRYSHKAQYGQYQNTNSTHTISVLINHLDQNQVYLQSSKNYFLRKYHVNYGLKVENYVITFKKKEKKLAQKVFCFCFIIMSYCIMQALEAAIYYVGLKTFYQNTNLTDFISMCTASNINYPNTGMK